MNDLAASPGLAVWKYRRRARCALTANPHASNTTRRSDDPKPEKLLISSQSERLVVRYLQTVVMKRGADHVILTASFIMNELLSLFW